MAVIETLAVRFYIQHVGGSCAPRGRILIISRSNLCALHFLSFVFGFFFFFLLVLSFSASPYARRIAFMCVLCRFAWPGKTKTNKRSISKQYWLSFKRCHPPHFRNPCCIHKQKKKLCVGLVPAKYLVLFFNSSHRLRETSNQKEAWKHLLKCIDHFHEFFIGCSRRWAASWGGLRRWGAHSLLLTTHTHIYTTPPPPCGPAPHFKGLSPWTF